MGDLSGVGTVVHQQKFELLEVGDGELAESVGKKVTGLLGRSVTDLGHRSLALEASADTTVNTLGLSPGFLLAKMCKLSCHHKTQFCNAKKIYIHQHA